MSIARHASTTEGNFRRGVQKDKALASVIKLREEKRRIIDEADKFSKLVMEMVL